MSLFSSDMQKYFFQATAEVVYWRCALIKWIKSSSEPVCKVLGFPGWQRLCKIATRMHGNEHLFVCIRSTILLPQQPRRSPSGARIARTLFFAGCYRCVSHCMDREELAG